jgi:hypothetical protein
MLKRPPLKVLITVDTEVWPKGESEPLSQIREDIQRDIYGLVGEREYGVRYQIDVLNAHGLKGVFLVEALFACAVGIEPLRELVQIIQKGGHEVQLHAHPEWLQWMPEPLLPGRTGRNLHEFTEEEQILLLRRALENLHDAGAVGVNAFRAGNYGADLATLRALARIGIAFDTSFNFPYLNKDCGLKLEEPLLQPRLIEGIFEVPISFFRDFPRHQRHAQLCGCSYSEMRLAIIQAWRLGWHTFVLVSHSFELLRRNRFGVPASPDSIVIKRFEKLCRFLSENRDRFQTAGFSDLNVSSDVRSTSTASLQSSIALTMLRHGEQAVRRYGMFRLSA